MAADRQAGMLDSERLCLLVHQIPAAADIGAYDRQSTYIASRSAMGSPPGRMENKNIGTGTDFQYILSIAGKAYMIFQTKVFTSCCR